MPERIVEPQFVSEDRTADRRIEVPDALDLRDVGQIIVGIKRPAAREVRARARLTEAWRRAVIGRPAALGEVTERLSAERIAAVARHHVDADAALSHLGRIGA